MLFSTVLVWLLVAIAFVVALPALWMFAQGYWPQRVQRQAGLISSGLLKPLLLGLLPLVVGALLMAFLSKLPRAGALAVLLGGLLITWGLMGSAGLALHVGRRLWPQLEAWRQVKHGGLTLVCSALLPVVGWAVLLPLLAVLGWGVQLQCLWSRQASGEDGGLTTHGAEPPSA